MADAALTDQAAAQSQARKATRSALAVVIPWVLVCGLGISHLATLLNEQYHDAIFLALATVVRAAGPAVAEAALAHSPARATIRAVETARRQLRSELSTAHARNLALQADIEAIKASMAVLATAHEALLAVSAQRAASVRAVTARTASTLASRGATSLRTLPTRAAPYIGIAATVTFTAFELQQNCELARELTQLNDTHGNEHVDTSEICKAVDRVPSPGQLWGSIKGSAGAAKRAIFSVVERIAARSGQSIDASKLN